MAVLFTSDLHIGHRGIIKYRDRFTSADQHHEYMLGKIEELGKRDLLLVLGDFIFDSPQYNEHLNRLAKVNCRVKLIMGNHDSLQILEEGFIEHAEALVNYKKFWLSHCPIHPMELRKKIGNIHGHLHGCDIPDERYFNVNIENHNYEFVELDTIKHHFGVQ